MSLAATLKTSLLEWLVKQETFPAVPASLFYSLHFGDPGDNGASELSSGTSPGYARAELAPDPDNTTNVNYTAVQTDVDNRKYVQNNVAIVWPTATNIWNSGNPLTHVGIWDASSSGTFLAGATITGTQPTVLTGVLVSAQANALTIYIGC